MPPPAPQFPTIDVWQQMEESEQDALIGKIERSRRRKAIFVRAMMVGIICAALIVGLTLAVELVPA